MNQLILPLVTSCSKPIAYSRSNSKPLQWSCLTIQRLLFVSLAVFFPKYLNSPSHETMIFSSEHDANNLPHTDTNIFEQITRRICCSILICTVSIFISILRTTRVKELGTMMCLKMSQVLPPGGHLHAIVLSDIQTFLNC